VVARLGCALATLWLAASACSEAEPAPATIAEAPLWAAEVDLRIGSFDDSVTMLTMPFAILGGERGLFYVSQPQDGNIRIHEADGRLVKTFGKAGEGPGEFGMPGFMGWIGGAKDTLWVSDFRLPRVSWFLADGTFVRTTQITTEPYKEVMRMQVQSVLADGTALGRPSYPSQMLADGSITSIPILHFPLAGGSAEPAAETEALHGQLSISLGDGTSYSNQPFGDDALTTTSGSHERVFIVDRRAATSATDARFRLTVITPAGDTVLSRDYPYEALQIPQAERDSVLAAAIDRVAGFASRVGASRADAESEVKKHLFLPDFRPPFQSMTAASDGSIWLQWTRVPGDTENHWLGIDADGDLIAKLDLPMKTRLIDVERSTAWAVETDALDIPYVLRLKIGPKP
jgi:hypothetical protein